MCNDWNIQRFYIVPLGIYNQTVLRGGKGGNTPPWGSQGEVIPPPELQPQSGSRGSRLTFEPRLILKCRVPLTFYMSLVHEQVVWLGFYLSNIQNWWISCSEVFWIGKVKFGRIKSSFTLSTARPVLLQYCSASLAIVLFHLEVKRIIWEKKATPKKTMTIAFPALVFILPKVF